MKSVTLNKMTCSNLLMLHTVNCLLMVVPNTFRPVKSLVSSRELFSFFFLFFSSFFRSSGRACR